MTNTAVITWTTNKGATTWVEYGPTAAYGSNTGLIDPTLVTSHTVTLTGLLPATTYHYRIHSRNVGGTDSVTTDATFQTPGGVIPVPTQPIWWGVWQSSEYATGDTVTTGIDTAVGKRPSLSIISQNWWSGTGYVTFSSISSTFTTARNNGQIPLLSWQSSAASGTPTTTLTNANISNGLLDAPFLNAFADGVAALGYPIFILLDQDPNKSTQPWYDSAGTSFVNMWQHVINLFNSRGATNVSWIWAINEIVPGGSMSAWWPGAAYVDWAILDTFNYSYIKANPWQTFDQTMVGSGTFNGDSWTALKNLDATGKVRFGVNIGSEDRNTDGTNNFTGRATWINDAFGTQIANYGSARDYSRIEMVLWYNQNNTNAALSNGQENWDIANDTNSQTAFKGALGPGSLAHYIAGNQFVLPSGKTKIYPYSGSKQPSKFSNAVMGTSPAHLVAYHKMHDSGGTTLIDSGPNLLNGTYTGGFTLSQPKLLPSSANSATSVLFDGTTGYATVANNAALSYYTTGAGTQLIVFNVVSLPAVGVQGVLVGKSASGQFEDAIRIGSTGGVESILWTLAGATYSDISLGAGTISTGNTYIVFVTVDQTRSPIMRIGIAALGATGGLVFTNSADSVATPAAGTGTYDIARRGDNTQFTNAFISHAARWNIALSDESMNEIFSNASVRRYKPRLAHAG